MLGATCLVPALLELCGVPGYLSFGISGFHNALLADNVGEFAKAEVIDVATARVADGVEDFGEIARLQFGPSLAAAGHPIVNYQGTTMLEWIFTGTSYAAGNGIQGCLTYAPSDDD